MKINIIPTLITLVIAALLAYLFYTLSDAEDHMLKALAISGFISTCICQKLLRDSRQAVEMQFAHFSACGL